MLNCSICQKEIPNKNGWDGGNNAQPINNGRCCDECDSEVVIPARIIRLHPKIFWEQAREIGRLAHKKLEEIT